jgi:glycosyltransferase involved in cell wall biosynthesis
VRNKVNARLLFLGDGEERAALTSLANNLGVASDVSFKGNVSNPLPFMKHAAVLALSSTVESFGLVLVEALAMGLPIVATDCPTGPREILRGGAYGTLVPVGDSSAFAEALVHVLQLPRRPPVPDEAFERFQHDRAVESYLELLGFRTETGER